MTNEVTKKRIATQTESDLKGTKSASAPHRAPVRSGSRDRRVTGYTRVKSGDLKRRSVSRAPDMSNPNAKALNPNVALGSLPVVKEKKRAVPVASVHVEPTVRTISDTKKVSFPYSIVFLSLICSVMFLYMIFNYVQINEQTAVVSDLKTKISMLTTECDNMETKLEKKNDLAYIERIATQEYGMVKIDEVTKHYISLDSTDTITPYQNS